MKDFPAPETSLDHGVFAVADGEEVCASFGDRRSGSELFGAERLQGIDGCGSPGGQVAGGQGDHYKQDSDCGEGEGVVRGDSEELTAHEAGEAESEDHAEDNTEEGHFCALAEDEAEDVGALRSEGHADADFAGAFAD
jgi:hypothetical protein